ncbi:MAG: hypothetical protein ACREM3_11795 [Candidatus Rokuibacteriota bacterium]
MSESGEVIRVPKSTGTHGDVFAAVGLANLLGSVVSGNITLRESETGFEVVLPGPVLATDARHIPQHAGYPFLKANEKVSVPAGVLDVVDYKAEKAKAERRKQARAAGKGKRARGAADPEIGQAMQEEQARDDWRLLQVLNTLQGDETANKVHAAIVGLDPDRWQSTIATALERLAHGDAQEPDWKVSTVQLFTPTAAKGYSRLKPDSTDRNDKTKDKWADPFLEWLKYRGYFGVACPFFQGSRGEHIRLLCPVPHDISARALELVARELRRVGYFGGPPKTDVLAVLHIAELLVRHSEEYHDPDAEVWPGLSLAGRTPATAVSGVMITNYQSLGNAKAVSAMSTLALPGWFPIEDALGARAWLEILDEHQRVVRGLRDDHSDEIGLLLRYRGFLERREAGAASALVEFMEHYGPFLLRAREQKRRVRSFRTDHTRRILTAMDARLGDILDDPGFQAVATAIRKATVNAQALKAMKRPGYREIRYDLLPEIRRKRSLPGVAPLVEVVSDFVCSYNVENARRREMSKEAPRNVTTEEFAAFARLVERHGPSLVGALLGAFGSCREPREDDAAQPGDDALSRQQAK